MSRLGRRRWLSTAAAALVAALVVVPAAAQAATYTVTPGNGPCGGTDLVCDSLVQAATAAADGDTFNVTKGTYDAATFSKAGLTITGEAGVAINGTMKFTATTGAVNKLSKVAVSNGIADAEGIVVDGAAGLELSDSVVVSKGGHGVLFRAGEANKIVRSVIVTANGSASAVRIQSTKGTPNNLLLKKLTLESTLLTGGASGIGVVTVADVLQSSGNVEITGRHITSAGNTHGISLDASAIGTIGNVGDITATLSDSISLNNELVKNVLNTTQPEIVYDVQTIKTGDPATIFAAPTTSNFRLKPGSPAIDKGGFTTGESDRDIDGDPRPGPTTDLGADEFVNAPPTAAIRVATANPRSLQPVTFDGSGSRDREAGYGGAIARYQWNFGDGQTQETTTPTVQHAYGAEGTAIVTLVVVDNFGAASAPASVSVTLGNGVPPQVKITKPTENQKLKLVTIKKKIVKDADGNPVKLKNGKNKTTTTRKKLKLGFGGTANDDNGVANVVLFVEKLSSSSTSASSTQARASQAATTASKCIWLDPKRGLIKRSCAKPFFILARYDSKAGTWAYNVSTKIKQPTAGTYRAIVAGVDSTGAAGNSATQKEAVVKFTLTK